MPAIRAFFHGKPFFHGFFYGFFAVFFCGGPGNVRESGSRNIISREERTHSIVVKIIFWKRNNHTPNDFNFLRGTAKASEKKEVEAKPWAGEIL